MTDLRTAAQRALEFCEFLWREVVMNDYAEDKREATEAALRAALAQQAYTDDLNQRIKLYVGSRCAPPQQAEPVEPVATVTECEACFTPDVCQLRGTCDYYTASQMRIAAPPQQAEPVQEPVAWMDIDSDGQRLSVRQWSDGNRDEVPLYTAPPQRKPLTQDEIPALAEKVLKPSVYYDVWALLGTDGLVALVRAVEQAHGIKE